MTVSIKFAFGIGDRVMITPIDADARVLELAVSCTGLRYLVAWWVNGERNEAYLTESELAPPKDGQPIKMPVAKEPWFICEEDEP